MAQSPEPPPHPRKFNTRDSERFNKKISICHCSVLARGVAGAAFEEADEMLGVIEAEAVADLRDRERLVVEQLARHMDKPLSDNVFGSRARARLDKFAEISRSEI